MTGLKERVLNWLIKPSNNMFNDAFLWAVGGGFTKYDTNNKTYLEEGYQTNPFVYSVVSQMAQKTAAVPIYVKKITDEKALLKLKRLRKATSHNMTIQQKVKEVLLMSKAFQDDELSFPMERPNPNQNWSEFLALYKTFLSLTGNVYIYLLRVEEGKEAGKPMAVYILPSHLIQIIVKKNTSMLGIESPIKGYMLTEGKQYLEFPAEDVLHIKLPNPEYSNDGAHLYGQSKLRAALKNLQSSNTGLDLNIKTLKSGGAFGFIHGKGTGITSEQAKEIKDRLIEMDSSPDNLSKIAGVSAEMGFTRISLTSDELKPFDFLNFDQKQICNVLGWSDSLLNNDNGGKYDKQLQERKRVVTDNIAPELNLLVESFNNYFLPLFKGYENTVLEFDIMELPEMQDNALELSTWLYNGLDKGVFTRNEVRIALRWIEGIGEGDELDRFTVNTDIISLKEALDNDFAIGNA